MISLLYLASAVVTRQLIRMKLELTPKESKFTLLNVPYLLLSKFACVLAASMTYLYKAEEEHKLRFLLARLSSWTFHYLMKIYIPVPLRRHIYGAFAKSYGVKLNEMRRNIDEYRSFNDFFTRQIREECRPISKPRDVRTLCSPCDGTVLSFGTVVDAEMICVKG